MLPDGQSIEYYLEAAHSQVANWDKLIAEFEEDLARRAALPDSAAMIKLRQDTFDDLVEMRAQRTRIANAAAVFTRHLALLKEREQLEASIGRPGILTTIRRVYRRVAKT